MDHNLTQASASNPAGSASAGERNTPARLADLGAGGWRSTELAQVTELFARSLEAARIGVWECNLDGEQLRWTNVVYDIFDLPRGSQLRRAEILPLYAPNSLLELERVRNDAIRSGGGFTLEAQINTARRRAKWIRITATVECVNGVPVRIFGLKQDITTEKLLAERTRYLAEYDGLTGLANRVLFQESLEALAGTDRPGAALLLLDLDGFKEVNDRYGHAQGDACLEQFGRRLKAVCAGAKVVARIGGDEFAILFDSPQTRDAVKRLADAIIGEFRSPILSGGESCELGVSIGIARSGAGADSSDVASLYTDADLALYSAKADGKNTFRFFERQLRDKARERMTTLAMMDAALAKSGLALHYQPQVRLRDGRLRGFEALLRRSYPDGRIVGPDEFRAAMDDPALSRRIGRWVLEEAIEQAARWRDARLDYGSLSINIGPAQINEGGFAETIVEAIARRELPPESIEIEITEGVFLDDDASSALRELSLLHSAGVRIAMDDFGTGYASLTHLRNYPIDVIKIDRSFVCDVLTSTSDAAILDCVISLGRRLGKTVVAEGVESVDHLAYLQTLGCQFAQGDVFSPALPADQAQSFMQSDWRWSGASAVPKATQRQQRAR